MANYVDNKQCTTMRISSSHRMYAGNQLELMYQYGIRRKRNGSYLGVIQMQLPYLIDSNLKFVYALEMFLLHQNYLLLMIPKAFYQAIFL